jgi:thiamine biosynthesis lipoprotein
VEVVTAPLVFDRGPAGAGAVEVVGARPAMGTRVAVTAVGPAPAPIEEAIAAAFDELDRLVAIFSRYESASAVSVLNQAGRLQGPPPELMHVVTRALALHSTTNGAFDVTVKPILDLLAERLPQVRPAAHELVEAAALVGARHVRVARGSVRFERGGMGLTLDGIAKGYIADRMAAILEHRGLDRYLIDGGGDIRVRGRNARGGPWVIGVRDPAGGPDYPDIIALGGGAVATSGGYERYYTADHAWHHIVSPETGRSPQEVLGASVVAPDGVTADALATAVVVLGAEAGLRLIDRLPRCAALVLDARGTPRPSRRWVALRVRPQEGIVS